ncbi:hypothetical protein [Streptacidiphilus fuscans]|uniref:Secreted protein n=1 Tax=Streptacidiphilus fuscans TaxID=2789292 RepID=A0A931AYP4_9ACTN|nr:hypothetical protein [Streptacidiphilus fuscans]MBF9067874.1 hypothetical protein [Streptacidiphilus fuscans]
MAKLGSGSVVTALTAGALAVVTLLAVQAKNSASATVAAPPGKVPAASASAGKGVTPAKPPAVPANSGEGRRVVYSPGQKRVWLVDPTDASADRTFTVMPGNVDPSPGSYVVFRIVPGPYTGSDGKLIKNAVLFASHDGAIIGFSSAVDGSTPPPDPSKHLGGIRESVADGQALYDFAPYNTKVVVVA